LILPLNPSNPSDKTEKRPAEKQRITEKRQSLWYLWSREEKQRRETEKRDSIFGAEKRSREERQRRETEKRDREETVSL
jgi:hypothetical protein